MPVSESYREFVLEQLRRVVPVTARAMFGGVGIRSDGLFFALMDDDTLYFKVDDATRATFEVAGMDPFRPYGEGSTPMQYYRVPEEALEDAESLAPLVHGALDAARRRQRTRG